MRKLGIAVFVILVIIFSIYLWWTNGLKPVNTNDNSQKVFVISKGEAIREIGNSLKKEGLIRDPVVFFILIKKNGNERAIQAGDYRLSPSMGVIKIVDELSHGTIDAWITIPEGLRAEEIADILEVNIKTYNATWREKLNENEGYLFPDTYLIPKDATIDIIISILKNNFYKKIESIGLSKSDPQLKKIVIIASLIEREALRDEEKPVIASVITNRLNDGIALDIDATLQYIKGKGSNDKWWNVPTAADKRISSLYNTYLYPGIPFGPISNPGINAIAAAKNPASSRYYYYLHDSKGNVYFAKTLEAHNANIQKYLK
ncbi:MAG: endolytic transglycosylase MltG [Candidatus Levybacteria bacterium CG_4_10_14_0_2_um_filter_36_16]|nr:MAG: hypothetical protein AUK12_01340 [Candidatus Levybacteria bacterium CG2_30_37_29]PIR78739.1 MAG: endolytic transglycosylase MltG [Candidatus Levybacteria bacterium CG10_big_fil_rev_8_21_14_0_10_36_30]PIZ96154.1 MAG: endolytic transglycosylase MltG [Candidatus Levybacteria bacterium CG_4_10_14_0_2_um_filter_36_16]PJA90694.1 MAG: endolytic transglycosylase MltG [Candidatus Levybacteria bacterium CG_4_9_14_3_um_filter_36_7]